MNRWVSSALFSAWALVGTTVYAADRFVGVVEGFSGAARVAVVVEGERWLVYACGESNGINESASRWWKGTADDGAFAAEADGASLTAELKGGKIVGELKSKEGASYHFIAARVAPGARAGAYRATAKGKDGPHVLSWIVDDEGLVVGCNYGGGKRAALKTAKLPPPKPIARRKPKPAEEVEADAEEPAEKPVARKAAKAPVKEAEEADEEDAKPAAAADEDDEGEKVVGKKVTTAAPAKAPAKKSVADDEDKDDDEKPAKTPAKKKPTTDDEDG